MDRSSSKGEMSLVDPAWEYIDPTPDIFALFKQFDKTFFNCTMDRVELKWSKRMTSCAGLMAPLEGRGGACSIRLSEPLLKLRPRKDLVETLLHEMIHAHLHVTRNNVYHDFHDEVNLHKQHWWRCNGPCRNWKPYYGWVKRATNRAPAKNDFWWAGHQQKCGGLYIKVKEPEGYGKKKEAQLKKSLGNNGNLLASIKKKYNVNHHPTSTVTTPRSTGTAPRSTGTTPKLPDMWKKKQPNVNSPKPPLKTINSTSPFQTKSSPPNISKNFKSPSSSFSSTGATFGTNGNIKSPSSSFSSTGATLGTNGKNIKSPSTNFSSTGATTGATLGTNGDHQSMNSILGQLHKENMERRRRISGKNNQSPIGDETKSRSQENHRERKPIFVDLTESSRSQPVSSKTNPNTSLISKKPNSLTKQAIQDSEQRSLSKALKDRNLIESKRTSLTNKVDFIQNNVELSFKSTAKASRSPLSSSGLSPEKKPSFGFSSTSVSSEEKKKSLLPGAFTNSSSNISSRKISSPESDKKDHSFLSKKDTATSILLLKKKRKRLLSSTDSCPDQTPPSSKASERQSWTNSSNVSNHEEKSKVNSGSSPLQKNKERLKVNSSPSHIPIKRHSFPDSSPSHSPFKHLKVSHTEPSYSPSYLPSLTPEKKHSSPNSSYSSNSLPSLTPEKKHSSPKSSYSSNSLSSLTPEKKHASPKSHSSPPVDKSKLFEALFGDDSDSETEAARITIQKMRNPDSSSASTSRNVKKTPNTSTSGSSFKRSTPKPIQSTLLDNYFTNQIKRSYEEDPIIINNGMASSGRTSKSQTSKSQTSKSQTSQSQTSKSQTSQSQTSQSQTSQSRTSQSQTSNSQTSQSQTSQPMVPCPICQKKSA